MSSFRDIRVELTLWSRNLGRRLWLRSGFCIDLTRLQKLQTKDLKRENFNVPPTRFTNTGSINFVMCILYDPVDCIHLTTEF